MDLPRQTDETYTIYLRKCELKRGHLVPRGDTLPLTLKEAMIKFAPSLTAKARANVLRAKRGSYLGLQSKGKTEQNFIISNPTRDGDIRWLLKKNPDMEISIKEVYLVDEVSIPRNAIDLPSIGGSD